MDLYLVRHGETQWNRESVFRGTTDIPLNHAGLSQARVVGQRLRYLPIGAVISSPLSRALATAKTIARHHGLQAAIEPGLTDLCFGEWQGLSYKEVQRRYPELYDLWRHHPAQVSFPGGGDLQAVLERSLGVVDRTLRGQEEAVVLISHRVVLKLLVCHALGSGAAGFWRVAVDPASVSVMTGTSRANLRVKLVNDVCHLKRFRGLFHKALMMTIEASSGCILSHPQDSSSSVGGSLHRQSIEMLLPFAAKPVESCQSLGVLAL